MKKQNETTAKITAVVIAVIAAIIAVIILLINILYPLNDSTFSNGYNSMFNTQTSSVSTFLPDEESSSPDQSNSVISEEPVASSQPTETVTSTPPQNTPTDLTGISPLKSRHEVPVDAENFNITLSFAGDMILATDFNTDYSGCFDDYAQTHDPSYFLEKVRPVFEADDFTIVNLENVLSDRPLTPVTKDYTPAFWFTAKTSNINILSCSSVEGALISNNHTRDFGQEGYNDTIQAVTNAGILYGDASRIMYFEKGGYVVSVICSGLWGEYQANNIVNLIKQAEQHSHYQIVLFHGGTEAIHAPEDWKRRAAHKMVDNGADLVVGGHPHVLQPREVYNGVEIIYSIGNFCFGANRRPENRTIIYQMSLSISKDLTLQASTSNIIPCYVYTGNINNFQPAIIEDEATKAKVLDFMNGIIDSPV